MKICIIDKHSNGQKEYSKIFKIFYYSQKEDPKISRITKFGGEMFYSTKNIALRSLQILYIFVSRKENINNFHDNFSSKMVTFFRA